MLYRITAAAILLTLSSTISSVATDYNQKAQAAFDQGKYDDAERIVRFENSMNGTDISEWLAKINAAKGKIERGKEIYGTLDRTNTEEIDIAPGEKLIFLTVTGAGTMHYNEAVQYCMELEAGGFSDWRLPSGNEMAMLHSVAPYLNSEAPDIWISYTDITINGMSIPERQAEGNMRYEPVIRNGDQLVIHRLRVNNRGDIVAGNHEKAAVIPVRTVKTN